MTRPKISPSLSTETNAIRPTTSTLERQGLLLAALLLITANLLTLLSGWYDVAGVLLLGILLPGVMGAAWLLRRALPSTSEFIAYSLGLGFVLYVLAMMAVTVLPGGLQGWQVLVAFNLVTIVLGIGWWRAQRTPATVLPDVALSGWALAGLVSVLMVAALLRLPNLGYSDFQGDEARAMLRAADIIQGYPSALTIHKKGPMEILLPTGIYAVEGQITEAQARFPFTLASLVGVFAMYLLGWRMFGAVAGWSAAMLLAVDGYLIGFARIVQYQSVVFCMSVLVVLALYRQTRADRPLPSYLLLAGLLFVGGAYSHYETAWVIAPGLYLIYVSLRHIQDRKGLLRAMALSFLVAVGLLLLFYVPFLLDTNWQRTADDIFGHRIGNTFPYDNVWDVFERSTIYDSAYQIFFMIIMAVIAQTIVLRKVWPRWLVWSVVALTVAGLATTLLVTPRWLLIGTTNHTWLFFALAVAVAIVPRGILHEERTAWLWFGISMVLSIFFVNKPNTHVYCFFIPWALVVGLAGQAIWRGLQGRIGFQSARLVALPVSLVLFAIFGIYTFLFFTYTEVEIFRTWVVNRPWGYWTPYALPTRGALFGFPYKNGWKVIGGLYADGTLDAPFDSSQTHRVTEWYGRGLYFCPPDAEYYMFPTTQQPDAISDDEELLEEVIATGYRQWGVVTVEGDERLRIFSKQPVNEPIRVFEESDYASFFNTKLTSPFFLKNGPALVAQPATTVNYRLKDYLWLKGYTLPQTQVVPGERLRFQLFWEATQLLSTREMLPGEDSLPVGDKTFVQLIDLNTTHKAAQRDGEPGCGIYPMAEWRPGELNLDPYTLTVAPDTPPGTYTLLVGIYDAKTHDRFPVFAADGSPLGDAIYLTTVEVVAP